MRAVDVKVVRVSGCDYSVVGVQLQERAVVFVGLYYNVFAFGVYHQIAAEVLAYAAKEGTASAVSLAEQVGYHGTGSGLAVTAGYSNATLAFGQFAKSLRTFFDVHTTFSQGDEFLKFLWHCGSIDNHVDGFGQQIGPVVIVHGNALGLQLLGQG